jgi:uncharacterized protein YjbI with pentapeptide repeats
MRRRRVEVASVDAKHFDRLVESLGRAGTRRGALRALAGAVFGGIGLGALRGEEAAGKDRRNAQGRGRSKRRNRNIRAQAASCCSSGACVPGAGEDLPKCCYEGEDLAGANFRRANLESASFRGATLTGADFSRANLSKVCFVDADLTDAKLGNANLKDAVFCRTRRPGGTLDNSDCGKATACCQTCVPLHGDRCDLGGSCCAVGAECTGGVCVCPSDLTECGQACVDVDTDERHCGACGNACPSGETCENGVCRCGDNPTCEEGLTCCSDQCVNLLTNLDHCTACGNACPRPLANAFVTCGPAVDGRGRQAYGCGYICNAGFRDCDGNPLTGCEQEIGDPNNPAACRGCPGEPGSACPAGKPRCCGCECFETTNTFCSTCKPLSSARLIRRR